MASASFWPILVASIVAFALGAIWYSPILFGKEWAAAAGLSDKDVSSAKARGVGKLYVLQFIFTIVTFGVLSFIVSASASVSAGDGAWLGFLVWLGFVVPLGISTLSWEKRPMKLVVINLIYSLVTLVLGGMIIAAWH